MSTRYFVKNNLNRDVREFKPGIGVFELLAGKELEIFDFVSEILLPTKVKMPYVHSTAKEVAESIVNDFGSTGLEVIEREEGPSYIKPVSFNPPPFKSLNTIENERKAKDAIASDKALQAAIKREDAREDAKQDARDDKKG